MGRDFYQWKTIGVVLILGCTAPNEKRTPVDGFEVDSGTEADSGTDVPSPTDEETGQPPEETEEEASSSLTPVALGLPLENPAAFNAQLGVDHDEAVYSGIERLICRDYLDRPFPHCYDEHDGTDFMLTGGFSSMDEGSARIVAAAAGEVIATKDGHYDRCHGNIETGDNDCDGHPMIANSVTIEHPSGHRSLYWHMMKDSVAVETGDWVERGTFLGLVGSSGNSSAPHLHFELQDASGRTIDPFGGPRSQDESWWCAQGDPDEFPGPCDESSG